MIKFLKERGVSVIIGLAISLIAVFYITPEQILLLINMYGAIGTILLIFIPLIIAFFFIYSSNILGVLRKIFWIFYGVMIIFLLQNQNLSSDLVTALTLILICVIVLILFLDTRIKNLFNARKNLKRR
jgi:hypothetical protein